MLSGYLEGDNEIAIRKVREEGEPGSLTKRSAIGDFLFEPPSFRHLSSQDIRFYRPRELLGD